MTDKYIPWHSIFQSGELLQTGKLLNLILTLEAVVRMCSNVPLDASVTYDDNALTGRKGR